MQENHLPGCKNSETDGQMCPILHIQRQWKTIQIVVRMSFTTERYKMKKLYILKLIINIIYIFKLLPYNKLADVVVQLCN